MPNFTTTGVITAAQTLGFKEQGEVLFGASLVTAASAVNIAGNSAILINNGTVISQNGVAVTGIGTGATIINTGFMSSKFSTISFNDTGIGGWTIMNSGVIAASGLFSNAITVKSGGLLLTNAGTITATGDPVILLEAGIVPETNVITNTGLVANANGLSIQGDADVERITNAGRIIGDIQLGGGANVLRSSGDIEGEVTCGAGADTIDLRGGFVAGRVLTGGGNDTLTGGLQDDRLNGEDGNDLLRARAGDDGLVGGDGNDTLSGGDGDDVLVGSNGQDRLTGGRDADVFDFNSAAASTVALPDTIFDFTRGTDDIDLSTIDAKSVVAGNQTFTFIGTAAFTDKGQVRVVDLGADVRVEANSSGGLGADMALLVLGVGTLGAADFIL